MMLRRELFAVAVAAITLCSVQRCHAASRTYEGSDNALGLNAEVKFEQIGSDLKVTLSNTSTHDVTQSNQVLTGVYFNLLNNPSLLSGSPAKATVVSPNSVLNGSTGANGNVGGEWAYKQSSSSLLSDYHQGISASGLGIFGPSDRFDPSQNLSGPSSGSLGGIDYGLVSAGDNPATGNTPILTKPLIKSSLELLFPGMGGLDLKNLDKTVRFQYGTSTTEPSFTGDAAPEPGSLSLLALAAAPLVARLRRRRRAA
jgi:hypothetical protein